MAVLSTQQRNSLETAVKQARKISEVGAFNALKAMAVDNHEPFSHMTADQRSLRNSLRSKARLLGDELQTGGSQRIDNLSYELAYETWHKMLFAKFLEANDLLIHTASGVAVSMEDCEELAKDEDFLDKWDAAANYASKMLPAIFRTDDPLMQITYATDERIKLEEIIDGLENGIFIADDALGWVYQFWQSEAKAVINASGDKIDGAKLPAVTQLFTEPYMVHFLIDNTLGAWWVGRNPGIKPPVKFDYLRLLDDGSPAAGQFEGWPDKTALVTSLDPCMGSGHFVSSLFPVFASLRMYEEGLSKAEATDKVISENLHGLELDPRCTQISAFNLALTAWKFCGHFKELPDMNLACSGIAPKGKVDDWVKLVGKVDRADDKLRLENGMRELYDHFQLAPELGSLLDPSTIKPDAFTASFEELEPVLKKALENEADTDQLERGVMAAGIAKAGQLLAKKYTLQITNVPYLSRGKQDKIIADYCEKFYPEGKGDIATVFLEKMLKGNSNGGISCSVIPQNWLFLTSYKKYREKLLKNETWNYVARLGVKGFQTPMWDFNVMLISIAHFKSNLNQILTGIDVSDSPNADSKDKALKTAIIKKLNQWDQLKNPDARIVIEANNNKSTLSEFAYSSSGQSSFDRPRFYMKFFEIGMLNKDTWIYTQGTSYKKGILFSGCEEVLRWENGNGSLARQMDELKESGYSSGIWRAGEQIWGQKGILISLTGELIPSIYLGVAFDQNCSVITAKDEADLFSISSFAISDNYNSEVRLLDQALKVTSATTIKCSFDIEHWRKNISPVFLNGWPKPFTNDPSQWLFHGNPTTSQNPLQVALARLIGYRWPAETDSEMELSEEAKQLIEAVKVFDNLSDNDGIFCIPSVNAEQAGADRLRTFLQAVFADTWHNNSINELLTKEGSNASNLEDWLRKEFFAQHCKLFQNRPFIWHIWDGRNDGFSALVNYNKLDKENLSKLIYTYLGDWIRMCEAKKRNEESGADGLLIAALKLKEKLEVILHGEAPYDIFVRWKPIDQQPIGWEPDLNDGVRLNIRPFVEAGVLRSKFNIKWGVDRGKNPPNNFWGEIRDNDKHLTLAEKRTARDNNKK
jgi:hypothetical protein